MKRFISHGLECAVLEGPLGNLNGYVRIADESHPLFGRHYFDLNLEVHGGCTYSDNSLPPSEEPDGWWIGFDTGHAGDYIPKIPQLGGVRRDEAYVIGECENLARQISCCTFG
jgi:hypothetical protein